MPDSVTMSNSSALLDLLADRRLLDGGYGWLLPEHGLAAGECAELLNVERPEVVGGLHEDFAKSGARLLTTNTFGGTRPRLDGYGLGDRVHELNRAGAAVAREVADRHGALVAGCVGPTGELLEPMGALTPEQAQAHFAEQIAGLVEGGADLILIETMSDLGEAEAALAAAREAAPGLPVIVAFSFDTNLHTMMGLSPAAAVEAMVRAGADAVGANCGRGPEELEQIVAAMVGARDELGVDLPILAQSNAGLPQVSGDGFVYDVDPAGMADHSARLRDLGVDLIGSCCGSTPAHTAAIADRLR